MSYRVTIASSDGGTQTHACAGANDQEALIYAGKIVEAEADRSDPDASVTITRDGKEIGPAATVVDMIKRVV